MADSIAKAFIQLQVDKKSLDDSLNRTVPKAVDDVSKKAMLKPGVNMQGMTQQIRTGLPALDRALIVAGSTGGTNFTKSMMESFRSSFSSGAFKKIMKLPISAKIDLATTDVGNRFIRDLEKSSFSKLLSLRKNLLKSVKEIGNIGPDGKAFVKIFSKLNMLKYLAGGVSNSFHKMWGSLNTISKMGVLGAIAGITIGLIKLGSASEVVNAKLKAMVSTTGMIAGRSTSDLDKLAKKLQFVSGASEDVIKQAQSILLSFVDIRGDIFDRTLASAQDLSVLLGTDIKSGVLQLGKAISDPAAQLGALTRSGVTFTEEQKKQIKNLQAMGELYKAQSKTLDIIEAQSKGVAGAVGKTISGSWGYFWNNTKEAAGTLGIIIAKLTATGPLLKMWGGVFSGVQRALEKVESLVDSVYEKISSLFRRTGDARLSTEKEITSELQKQLKLITGSGFESISRLAQQFSMDNVSTPVFTPTTPVFTQPVNPYDVNRTVGENMLLKQVIASQNDTIEAINRQTTVLSKESPFYGF